MTTTEAMMIQAQQVVIRGHQDLIKMLATRLQLVERLALASCRQCQGTGLIWPSGVSIGASPEPCPVCSEIRDTA